MQLLYITENVLVLWDWSMQDSGANTLGVVVGGSSIELRKLCATEVSKRNVSGYFHLPLNTINFQ